MGTLKDFRGNYIMKQTSRRYLIIGAIVCIALIAGYFSYQSYSNISVNHQTTTSEHAKPDHKATASKKTSKKDPNDENIFLVDQKNPDRIIAINPGGSKGIYQYRKQSDGMIYPEFKFFNGSISYNKNGIEIVPDSKSTSNDPFRFTKTSDGAYIDKSAQVYYKMYDGFQNTTHTADSSGLDPNSALLDPSDPSATENNPSPFSPKSLMYLFRLSNGDLYQPYTGLYYGKNWKSFNVSTFNSKDKSQLWDTSSDIMYYKQNESTALSSQEIKYYQVAYRSKSINTQFPNEHASETQILEPIHDEYPVDWSLEPKRDEQDYDYSVHIVNPEQARKVNISLTSDSSSSDSDSQIQPVLDLNDPSSVLKFNQGLVIPKYDQTRAL